LTNTTEPAAEHPPIFLDYAVSNPDTPRGPSPSPPRRKGRRSTKGDRYRTDRVEKGISRRVRRDGRGKPVYDVQVWVNGRALSKSFTSLRDARRWRDEMLGARATGRAKIPADRRITVAQFVTTDWYVWLDEQARFGNLRPGTVSWYKSGARRLVDEIGRIKLANVGKGELRGMLARRIEGGDSQSILRQLRATTRSVLALAIESDILTEDPSGFMTGRNAPRPLRRPANTVKSWSASEAQAFLQHVVGDPLEALWVLLLGSGLRRGEALALRWDDVDLKDRTVSVSRSLGQLEGVPTMSYPKTENSTRVITVGRSVVETLQAHRRRQSQERLAAGNWQNDEGLIFTTPTGGRLRPDFATRRLKKLVSEAGLPWITLHGLRHTMASIALQNGTDIATVSERLGHADTSITARIYLHGSKESDREAADVLDEALHG